jgi:hypothetical protein
MPHCHGEHCEHEHEDLPGSGEQALLYSRIDRDNIRCLNEAEPDSGKTIVKPWDQRLDNDKVSIHGVAFSHPNDYFVLLTYGPLVPPVRRK